MSDPFDNMNLLRIILEGESDADSPGSEEFFSQLRENWEVFLMLFGYTGDSGTATSDPPNDTTGVLTDTGAAYAVDEHNGRSLVMIDGLAAGNIYTIDDTTATTLICTGDNLYSDGVRQNDAYKVFFDLKSTDAHDHDGVDSKAVTGAAAGTIGQAELKSTTAENSGTCPDGGSTNVQLPGGDYGLAGIKVKKSAAGGISPQMSNFERGSLNATYTIPSAHFTDGGGSGSWTAYVEQRYVQASGEVFWFFIMRVTATKEVLRMFAAPDHPCMMFSRDPDTYDHPWIEQVDDNGDPVFNPAIHEIIVVNPTDAEMETIKTLKAVGKRSFLEVIEDEFDIDDTKKPAWPKEEITVGLPDNWQDLPIGTKVTPVKQAMKQPAGINTAAIKQKAAVIEV